MAVVVAVITQLASVVKVTTPVVETTLQPGDVVENEIVPLATRRARIEEKVAVAGTDEGDPAGEGPLRFDEGVRIRAGNLTMTNHPIHLHGHEFVVAGTDGGWIPPAARWPEVTIVEPAG